jgi:fructokinase
MVVTGGIEAGMECDFDYYKHSVSLGGTTFVVSIAKGNLVNVIDRCRFPTSSIPTETMQKCIDWLNQKGESIDALGVASFGPVCLNRHSPNYGQIERTPKEGWVHFGQ